MKTPSHPFMADESEGSRSAPVLVSIMGAVATGKSTLITAVQKQRAEEGKGDELGVVPEPMNLFKDVHGHGNLLEKLYDDPYMYAAPFQQVAMYGLAYEAALAWRKTPSGVLLVERSIIDTHYIFSRVQREDGNIRGIDIGVEKVAFDALCMVSPCVWPRAIIYLESTPEACWERVLARNRPEEVNGTPAELAKRRAYFARICARYDAVVEDIELGKILSPWGEHTPVVRLKSLPTREVAYEAIERACDLASHAGAFHE